MRFLVAAALALALSGCSPVELFVNTVGAGLMLADQCQRDPSRCGGEPEVEDVQPQQ